MNSLVSLLDAYAAILLYPMTGHDSEIRWCIGHFGDEHADVRERVLEFHSRVAPLALFEREELYIKTFDLNKAGTLDLGWHLFGEDYNRGLFLVKLRQYLRRLEIEETSELPDHVSHVLRILGRMSRDEADLFAYSCVIPSLETIGESIPQDNPYDGLIEGLIQLLRHLFDVPDGFEENLEPAYTQSARANPFVQLPIIQ